MAIRKGFRVNVKANMEVTASDSIYVDIKQDTTRRLRFLPPVDDSGRIFTKIVNHFKLKTDDDPPRGMAPACLRHFKDEECYLCDLSESLKKSKDKNERALGDEIRASARYYAPVVVAEKNAEGVWEYGDRVKLVGLPKTGVDDVNAILLQQDMVGDDYFCDEENGQDLLLTRTGFKYQTKYKPSATGIKMPLEKVMPDWEDKQIKDVAEVSRLKFLTYEEQEEAARRTFGDDVEWADHEMDVLT